MSLNADLLDEIRVLNLYNQNNSQQGIKIHSDADPAIVAAAGRLFDKGIITLADGGYLTTLGQEAAEHAQALITMLNDSAL